jgi:hypothetical protein
MNSYSDLIRDDAARIGTEGEHEYIMHLCGRLGYRSLSEAMADYHAAAPEERRDRDALAQGWTPYQQISSFFLTRCQRLPNWYSPGATDMRTGRPLPPVAPAVR